MDKIEEEIRSILNLGANELIGAELANRQLRVITKAYQYLSKPGNNIIYIADEVGLGKTYIAAGIAILFRHYSTDITNHRDLIIVPKKNLQVKWRKELNNFIDNNYLPTNDLIRKQFKSTDILKDRLVPLRKEDSISIFRMTSFSSLALRRNKKTDLFEYLTKDIFSGDDFANNIINDAWVKGYFNTGSESYLRKVVSYLLNAVSPKVNCLIIDEAHNYKHGLGNEEYDESIRNEVTARFLGAISDSKILNEFQALRDKLKLPLSEKIICLSATPKDRSLIEIKNQFSCFTNHHLLEDSQTVDDVKSKLKKFLIRGNMEFNIDNKFVSRNQCRYEHRLGNVNKGEKAVPLVIEDNFESIFWQLLQYQSIKYLNTKNNATFEIGMLAGFESYQLDAEKKKKDSVIIDNQDEVIETKEYEQTASKKIKESQDYNVIKQLIDSYQDSFSNEPPPHPKQTKLESEIINQIERQDKSIVFVRRVATAYELEKRLLVLYEKNVIYDKLLKFSGRYNKFNTDALKELQKEFNSKHILERLNDVFTSLLSKNEIKDFIRTKYANILENEDGFSRIWLNTAFSINTEFEEALAIFISNNLKNISQVLKETTIKALEHSYNHFILKIKEIEDDDSDDKEDDEKNGYFFVNYFKKGNDGFSYRNKMYRENWFELSILHLNRSFHVFMYDQNLLEKKMAEIEIKESTKKSQLFRTTQDLLYTFLIDNASKTSESEEFKESATETSSETTFLTELLTKYCFDEMNQWFIKRINKYSIANILKDLIILNAILRGIFRNGNGLLPGFLADATELNFTDCMNELLGEPGFPFHFVLNEIKTIIKDFDLLISINFQEKDENTVNKVLKNLSPVIGTTGQDKRDRGVLASQFRMPGFPYVLVTTDIFREGEDLHSYCKNIYHYGIAWNPSDMEQRTGRIDRINSLSYRNLNQSNQLTFDNKIQVFYPYLTQSVEVNQVIELLKNIDLFIETFNEIELDNKYESNVKVDLEFRKSDIPKQITDRLESLYDIAGFEI